MCNDHAVGYKEENNKQAQMSQVGCVVTHWIVGNEQDKGIPNAQSKNRIRNHMRRYSAFAIAREGARYHTGWERAWKSSAPKNAMMRSS